MEKLIIKRALISSWRKEAAVRLAERLARLNISITASGGTAKAIAGAGIPIQRLEEITGFEDLLGGRVKTLHPLVHAAVLARRERPEDLADLQRMNLQPFDFVAVDCYPFPFEPASGCDESNQPGRLKSSLPPDQYESQVIELIDIGGIALIRAAAKNHRYVLIACCAEAFDSVMTQIERNSGTVSAEYSRRTAAEAFAFSSAYDSGIARRLDESMDAEGFPPRLTLAWERRQDLRYGENPHQKAIFYQTGNLSPSGLAAAVQLGGKELSFNNLLDLDIALRLPREFERPAAALLKHTTPCGIGLGDNICNAFRQARSTDPVSAYGGIVGLNRPVDLDTARAVREGFVEVIAAPGYESAALKELRKSKNLRIIESSDDLPISGVDFRSVWGGMLYQEWDKGFPEFNALNVVTERSPDAAEWEALKFLWVVVRYVKSNAIVLGEKERTLGIGAGQMSRVDAARIAIQKAVDAGLNLTGAAAASDAFFPFRDGLDILAQAGIRAVIQPGGSLRDEEVIAAANERHLAMVFTGRRHFRH